MKFEFFSLNFKNLSRIFEQDFGTLVERDFFEIGDQFYDFGEECRLVPLEFLAESARDEEWSVGFDDERFDRGGGDHFSDFGGIWVRSDAADSDFQFEFLGGDACEVGVFATAVEDSSFSVPVFFEEVEGFRTGIAGVDDDGAVVFFGEVEVGEEGFFLFGTEFGCVGVVEIEAGFAESDDFFGILNKKVVRPLEKLVEISGTRVVVFGVQVFSVFGGEIEDVGGVPADRGAEIGVFFGEADGGDA